MKKGISFLVCFLAIFPLTASARLIQLIHTNDLHSYFTGQNDGSGGGYARVRTKILELREEAKNKGIEVLQLDAGDWGDGTSFYLSDNGVDSIRALELLGIDVATIGNHDHLLGGKVLSQQIKRANVKTKFTVANIKPTPEMDWDNIITPYVDFDRGGIKIRVIGLTTDSSYYSYAMAPGKITSPSSKGDEESLQAEKDGRELVIALTHIGITVDKYLASKSSAIDVIVGGHTHSKLTSVSWAKNKKGKSIPIVQAWAHGLTVGTLLLDVKDDGSASVVEYKLHEVKNDVTPDPLMVKFIEDSKSKRDQNLSLGSEQIIGETKTPIAGYKNGRPVIRSSCWGKHMAKAARLAVGAGVGIHLSQFEGMSKAAGPVSYADIANSYPHFRKYGDQGWEIATVTMSGVKLRTMMYWISRRGYGVTFSGLGYRVESLSDLKTDDKAYYRIAIPAEVALAIKTSLPGYRKYLQGLKYTGKYYWAVAADYIQKNSPIGCNGVEDELAGNETTSTENTENGNE